MSEDNKTAEVKLSEAEAKITELEEKLKKVDNTEHFNKLKQERDEAKTKLKELEDSKLTEKEEFKTLAEKRQAELEEKMNELNITKSELEEAKKYKEELDKVQTARRTELLERVDATDKPFAEKLSLEQLEDYAKLHSKVGTDNRRSGGKIINTDGKKWKDFSTKELEQIEKDNPEVFKQLQQTIYAN